MLRQNWRQQSDSAELLFSDNSVKISKIKVLVAFRTGYIGDSRMKTVVLFGAGQVGAMVSRLIGTGYSIPCFADNSESKWGGALAGIPVVSPKESLLYNWANKKSNI